jgi:hypothetical protein
MACERHHEALIELALGAHKLRLESELSEHLESCAACRRDLDAQRRLAAAINLGVAASVAAEPSPEFAARIRQRIASEPAPVPAWGQGIRVAWVPLTAGALAVVLLAFWLARRQPVSPLHPTPDIVRVQPPSTSDPVPPQSGGNGATLPPKHLNSNLVAANPGPLGRRTVQIARTTEPEVIVFPGERDAVLQFYAAMRSGRTDVSSLLAAPPLEIKIKDLEVPPLEVPAIAPSDTTGESGNGNPSRFEREVPPRRL